MSRQSQWRPRSGPCASRHRDAPHEMPLTSPRMLTEMLLLLCSMRRDVVETTSARAAGRAARRCAPAAGSECRVAAAAPMPSTKIAVTRSMVFASDIAARSARHGAIAGVAHAPSERLADADRDGRPSIGVRSPVSQTQETDRRIRHHGGAALHALEERELAEESRARARRSVPLPWGCRPRPRRSGTYTALAPSRDDAGGVLLLAHDPRQVHELPRRQAFEDRIDLI